MAMRVIITGCNGYVGKTVSKYYYTLGYNVVGFDLINSKNSYITNFYQTSYASSIAEDIILESDADTLIHCAVEKSNTLQQHFYHNSIQFINLLTVLKNTSIKEIIVFRNKSAENNDALLKLSNNTNKDYLEEFSKSTGINSKIYNLLDKNNEQHIIELVQPYLELSKHFYIF